jgi:hypothetical protein
LAVLSSDSLSREGSASIERFSTFIETLNVSGVDDPAALSKSICRMKSLQNLQTTCVLTSEAVLHVTSLPSLHSLEVANDAQQILAVLQSHPSRHYLPDLYRFSTTSTVPSCTALLDFLRPNTLQALFVKGPPGALIPLASEYGTLFSLMSQICPSLHTLHIAQVVRPIQSPISDATLRPLLTLKNMISLSIASPIDLTNATIGAMASAWPKLKSLALLNGDQTCGITVECLIPLAMQCPSLNYLAIPLHVSATDNLSTQHLDNNFIAPLDLTELRLPASTFEHGADGAVVNYFLQRLFPNLSEITPTGNGLGRRWLALRLALSFSKVGLLPRGLVGHLYSSLGQRPLHSL